MWRRVAKIVTWILIFPPIGLWMVWKDPVLSKAAKGRIVIYSIAGGLAFAVGCSCLEVSLLNRTLKEAGVDF